MERQRTSESRERWRLFSAWSLVRRFLFMKATKGSMMATMRSKWDYGIFVGGRPRSNKICVATAERTWKVRSVRRLPEDVRWSSDSVNYVRRTVWNRFQGDEQADGEIPEGKAAELPPQETKNDQAPRGLRYRESSTSQKKTLRSTDTLVVALQPRTAECRERFRTLMSDDARGVQLANQKRQRFAREDQERKRSKEEKGEDRAREKEARRKGRRNTTTSGHANAVGRVTVLSLVKEAFVEEGELDPG